MFAALVPAALALFLTGPLLQSAIGGEREKVGSAADPLPLDWQSAVSAGNTDPQSPSQDVAVKVDADPGSMSALLPEGMPPRVLIKYLHSSSEAARRANDLAKTLRAQGIEVIDVRESVAVVRTELRYFYISDHTIAQQVGRLADIKPTRAILAMDGLTPRPGAMQLSLGR